MTRFSLVLVMFFLAGFTVACGGEQGVLEIQKELTEIEAEVGQTTEVDCPLKVSVDEEGETYACGVYTVPLDYDNPQGDSLNLTYTVLRATGADPLPDPIVYLAGGPGQSSLLAASGAVYGDLREKRDRSGPAQRGTLVSSEQTQLMLVLLIQIKGLVLVMITET